MTSRGPVAAECSQAHSHPLLTGKAGA
ncbi:hypothetical protein AvCA_12100 [Azotobacter vinelandii CA]|uniref:Uncharacterized protein n=2 Tax=Azotobacter vinelandii TaxID=354 RepID=C1DPK3_AZOVD|nr:hypothetical protein Avin_12100 [Azotobacter vinelandii DJ]AGK15376.1 hypothetical protein AvCA_12100 [Azotobacter vinelandii CA]AGK19792.1 hypothetical protein AvCA6_12100 [Azotobacter vinelandii CA6]